MKKLCLVLLFLGLSTPLSAAPRWLTYVPRAVGRTYGNMFTFKHPVLALEQWASVGALVFDEKTTMDVFARCQYCTEGGIINHGKRYGVGIATVNIAIAGTIYTTAEQVSHEGLRNDPNWFFRHAPDTLFLAPVIFHTTAGIGNMKVLGDKEEEKEREKEKE